MAVDFEPSANSSFASVVSVSGSNRGVPSWLIFPSRSSRSLTRAGTLKSIVDKSSSVPIATKRSVSTIKSCSNQPKSYLASPESLVTIIDAFLDWTNRNRSPDTYEWYRYRLQRFVDKYPEMKVSSLKPFHVEEWVDQYDIAKTTRRNYFRSIKRCLAWAKKQGRIDRNPLEGMDIPGAERREVYVPPEEFETLLTHAPDPRFRDLLITTYQTGCRPQESLRVIGGYVDQKNARWVFPSTKSKGKKSPRIIYLNDTAMEISNRLLDEFPESELFRNAAGRPWSTEAVNCAFDRVQVRIGKEILDRKVIEGPTDTRNSQVHQDAQADQNGQGR